MKKSIRPLSLVELKTKWSKKPAIKHAAYFNDQPLIYLGEIPNMPEHGVFISHISGRIYSGLHISQFKEMNE